MGCWITTDPAGFIDGTNLYAYLLNDPLMHFDPNGEFAFMIPLFMWGAELAIPALSACITPIIYGAITGAVAYGGFQLVKTLNEQGTPCMGDYYAGELIPYSSTWVTKNTNPFDAPVEEDIIVVDGEGNAIKVPQGNWLTGTKDGKWLQEMRPGGGPKGEPTGQRKDGGGHPPPKHTDSRANAPHAHVPGVTNPDGTEWLPIK